MKKTQAVFLCGCMALAGGCGFDFGGQAPGQPGTPPPAAGVAVESINTVAAATEAAGPQADALADRLSESTARTLADRLENAQRRLQNASKSAGVAATLPTPASGLLGGASGILGALSVVLGGVAGIFRRRQKRAQQALKVVARGVDEAGSAGETVKEAIAGIAGAAGTPLRELVTSEVKAVKL